MKATTDARGDATKEPVQSDASVDAESPSRRDAAAVDASSSSPGTCMPTDPNAPRLLSPHSGSIVTSARPVFRWLGAAGPYLLRVCADRACARVIQGTSTSDTEVTLPQDLAPGYWFWQVKAIGASPSGWNSAWEMRVRRRFPGYAPVANTSVRGFSDYNGDGYPDVAAWGAVPMVYLGGPDDGISGSRVWPPDPDGGLGTALLEPQVDVNGDGFTDLSSTGGIIVGGQGSYAAHIQCGGGNRFTSFVDVFSGGAYDFPIGVGDFFGDGFGELIMQSRYTGVLIRVFGTNVSRPGLTGLGCGSCQLQQVDTGDFNGDGLTDFVFADATAISLYMGNPDGATPETVAGMSGLAVVDLNYDGYSDLMFHNPSSSPALPYYAVDAYEGGPDGLSTTVSTASLPPFFSLVGDFDGDGYWDTIGASGPQANPDVPPPIAVAYGGPGGWGAPAIRTTTIDLQDYPMNALVADVNADGYDDVVVRAAQGQEMDWYAGSPGGLSPTPTGVVSR